MIAYDLHLQMSILETTALAGTASRRQLLRGENDLGGVRRSQNLVSQNDSEAVRIFKDWRLAALVVIGRLSE